MATLVLTAAGSVFGPIGGAIGALLGQQIDNRILQPKGREGPRLQDLRVQTSSYGAPIPKLFGVMRVAGTVIWSTDLIERRARVGGGKGRPKTTTYSYSASFAVALSSRPILSVRRIWADANLLRGEAGDWKQETGYRLHLGGEDQPPDPFIVAAEGGDGTPAYRGCAYAVFENMALEPYGNRIPSLTFEVESDPGPISVPRMLGQLSGRAIQGGAGPQVGGFAASGDSLSALIGELARTFPLTLGDDGDVLTFRTPEEAPTVISLDDVVEGSRRVRPAQVAVPDAVTVSHYDPERDYQIGVQGGGAGGRTTERLDLPAAVTAGEARALAEAILARRRRERNRLMIKCGWSRLALPPGSRVRIGPEPAAWRILSRSIDRSGVTLELGSHRPASSILRPAEPGRSLSGPDRVHGPTRIALLDLPGTGDQLPNAAQLGIAAWGLLPGWRRANLLMSFDEGTTWEPLSGTALPTVAGVCEGVLPTSSANLVDEASVVVVQLSHSDMMLEDADDARLRQGANLAAIGRELVQFGSAEPLGGNRWRLSHLLRGRLGTEWARSTHAAGETFVLIEADAIAVEQVPLASLGRPIRIMASGLGDPTPQQAAIEFEGEALQPLSPVHLVARPDDAGGFDLSWIRRSRVGSNWGDVDAPLGEDEERYRVTFRRADGAERASDCATSTFRYAAGAVSEDRSVGEFADVDVRQIGSVSMSRPASIRIIL